MSATETEKSLRLKENQRIDPIDSGRSQEIFDTIGKITDVDREFKWAASSDSQATEVHKPKSVNQKEKEQRNRSLPEPTDRNEIKGSIKLPGGKVLDEATRRKIWDAAAQVGSTVDRETPDSRPASANWTSSPAAPAEPRLVSVPVAGAAERTLFAESERDSEGAAAGEKAESDSAERVFETRTIRFSTATATDSERRAQHSATATSGTPMTIDGTRTVPSDANLDELD